MLHLRLPISHLSMKRDFTKGSENKEFILFKTNELSSPQTQVFPLSPMCFFLSHELGGYTEL